MEEISIMPPSPLYEIERKPGLHRHEVFYGRGIRQKSIYYGLFVFLTPERHNMSNQGVHFNKEFDLELKRIGQKAIMDKYGWDKEKFIREFHKNYLEE